MEVRSRLALLAVTFALCLPAAASAQGFHSVFSKDGTDAWAVGDAGLYYRSLDGGLSWGSGSLGPSRLRDVAAQGLRVVVVGDSGKIWVSTNNGGAWNLNVAAGTPELRALALPAPLVGYTVGSGGRILKTENGGASWTPQSSGTTNRLNAVRFVDDQRGWVVGDNGTVLKTEDGGTNWTPVSVGTSNTLYGVDQLGTLLWIVGAEGTAVRSTDGGALWSRVPLGLEDAGTEVRTVHLRSPDSIYVAGGGGFIRRSFNGGTHWDYPVHSMHGQISDLHFAGNTLFASSNRNRMVMSTIDRGTTWRLPTGATLSRSWELKQTFGGSTRGGTFGLNNTYRNTIFCALGNIVYRSQDAGDTWASIATIPQTSKVNAFIVSPKDTNVFIAAVSGVIAKRVARSDDYGQTWFTTLTHDFGEYGIPLEYDHDRPDTIYFGADNDRLYRSTDCGKNWEQWSNIIFRSPCDLIVVPDSGNVILLGDGITGSNNPPGQYYRSVDWGEHFTLIETRPNGASEVPGMSNCRLRKEVSFGTNWGSGGVQRTTNFGASWSNVAGTASAWGTDIARDDPNVVIYGVYSGGQSYLSLDGGQTFSTSPLPGSNYSFYLRDRGLILAEQSGGIYKMAFNYAYTPSAAQSVALTSPNGGETWEGGSTRDITWNSQNMALARIEYRRTPADAWQLVAEVPGYTGRYTWTVPGDNTTQARVRVRDAWDTVPEDQSNGDFTVHSVIVQVAAPGGGESWQYNSVHPITWSSANVTNVSLDYRTVAGGAWVPIASGIPAGQGSYDWTIPFDPTDHASVRVRNASGSQEDISEEFRIISQVFALRTDEVRTALILVGTTTCDSLRIYNYGNAPLTILSVTSDDPNFWPGRTSLVIPPFSSDTIGVCFEPSGEGRDSATLVIAADDPATPHSVLVTGVATTNTGNDDWRGTSFALWQNRPNPFTGRTQIRYALPVESDVNLEVFNLQGQRVATLARGTQGPGLYTISFGRGAGATAGNPLETLPSGVYFYRFQAGAFSSTRKMLVLE